MSSGPDFETGGGGVPEFDVEPYDETEGPEYDTGPFCRHYGDPTYCDHLCGRCGHKCSEHDQDGEASGKCNHTGNETGEDCTCPDWKPEGENDGST